MLAYINHERLIMATDDFGDRSCNKKIFKVKTGKDDNTTIEDLFMEKICIVRRRIQIPGPAELPPLIIEKEGRRTNELVDLHTTSHF